MWKMLKKYEKLLENVEFWQFCPKYWNVKPVG